MGTQGFFEELEGELDKRYKEGDLLVKLVQWYSPKVIAAGLVLATIAAPFLGMLYSSSRQDFERQVRQEAKQEILRSKKECEQEFNELKARLDVGQEQVQKKEEELYEKEHSLRLRKIEVDSTARIAEFDKTYLRANENLLQAKKDLFNQMLDKRECSLDTKEAELNEKEAELNKREAGLNDAEKKIEQMFLDNVTNHMLFSRVLDLNYNAVLDLLDTEISKRFLGGIDIFSSEYIEAVRYIYSPAVIKKLEQYGISTHVICIDEKTIVVPDHAEIGTVIENVPPDFLHDFVVNPKGKEGLEEMLHNTCVTECNPVYFTLPEGGCGSGFVLCDNYVVTANHVAKFLNPGSYVRFEDGKKIEVSKDSIIASSAEHDIAIIKCDFTGYKPVALQEDAAQESCVLVPRSKHSVNSEKGATVKGIVRRVERVCFDSPAMEPDTLPAIEGTDRYLASLTVYPGDSGSAVLNQKGELIGVAVGVYSACDGAASIVRAKYLKKLLDFYMKKTE